MAIAANKVGGFDYVGIELNEDYYKIALERIAHAEHDLINYFGQAT
jgi:DNA modification methylase